LLVAVCGVMWLVGSPAARAAPASIDPRAFTVYHGDAAGTGVVASIKTVDTATPAWTSPALDGQIYGEPLVSTGRVYVATENDTVYALSTSSGAIVWSRHLGTPVPSSTLPCGDITPVVGITGTPVIDPARGEIFVVADESVNGSPSHRLVGLSLSSGTVEMTQTVDPPGADTAAILQRTGLTLDAGRVVFGFGGNYGDCSTYHGWVVAVGAGGSRPIDFEVDSGTGDTQGAIWMGGAAPAVDSRSHIWVEAGNGSVTSSSDAYDDSDSVLELSSSLKLLQYFAPTTWPSDNATDRDFSMEPVLLSDGDVVAAGKSRIAFLLKAAHLGGIGGQQSELGSLCSDDIDGGSATVGTTVYLPCLSGIVAIQVDASPAGLHLLWSSGTGGGPPLVAAGLVWTIAQSGELYGLDPTTGRTREQAPIGAPANHFPTPSVGDGLLLAPSADRVVAFEAKPAAAPTTTSTASTASTASTSTTSTSRHVTTTTQAGGNRGVPVAAITAGAIAALAAGGGVAWLILRRRRRAGT
jgi:outer membrane protein assembly factor BamB